MLTRLLAPRIRAISAMSRKPPARSRAADLSHDHVLFALTTTVFLLTFVMPRFHGDLRDEKAALPAPTQIMMNASDILGHAMAGDPRVVLEGQSPRFMFLLAGFPAPRRASGFITSS